MGKRDSGFGIRGSGLWLVSGLALLVISTPLSHAAQSTGSADGRLKITVRIYSYAEVSNGTMARAEEEASRIFRDAGIEVAWLECPASRGGTEADSACEQVAGLATLNMKILPAAMAARLNLPQDTLGHALPSSNPVGGSEAWVFYPRVERLAESKDASRTQILGHAMAHELGHLLLGADRHSSKGLMRAHWGREDLQRLATGQLLFTPGQVELIRVATQERVRREEASRVSRLSSTTP